MKTFCFEMLAVASVLFACAQTQGIKLRPGCETDDRFVSLDCYNFQSWPELNSLILNNKWNTTFAQFEVKPRSPILLDQKFNLTSLLNDTFLNQTDYFVFFYKIQKSEFVRYY